MEDENCVNIISFIARARHFQNLKNLAINYSHKFKDAIELFDTIGNVFESLNKKTLDTVMEIVT